MKKGLLFVVLFSFIAFIGLMGCAGGDIVDEEGVEIDVIDEDGYAATGLDDQGDIETVVIDAASFSEEPSVRAEVQNVSGLRVAHFNFDSNSLSRDAMRILQSNAEYLLANPSVNIVVEGHCDNRGTVAYNLALGQRRAMKVKEYYVQLGISAGRIATISYGEEQPIDMGENEIAWAKNRRAETKTIRN
jgi:peptidoglycan-associated lipoprotein